MRAPGYTLITPPWFLNRVDKSFTSRKKMNFGTREMGVFRHFGNVTDNQGVNTSIIYLLLKLYFCWPMYTCVNIIYNKINVYMTKFYCRFLLGFTHQNNRVNERLECIFSKQFSLAWPCLLIFGCVLMLFLMSNMIWFSWWSNGSYISEHGEFPSNFDQDTIKIFE